MADARPGRIGIVIAGVTLLVAQVATVLAWWLLPRLEPELVIRESPWPEPALRAWRHGGYPEMSMWPAVRLEHRLLDWGPAIGPALRSQFARGDQRHRLRIVALANHLARLPGIAARSAFAPGEGGRFDAQGVAEVREDLYQLALAALADGSSHLPGHASFIACFLEERRLVPPLCDALRGARTPLSEDIEPLVAALGRLGDPRAVAVLIPLLPIRHKAHPTVEDALGGCLDAGTGELVLAATHHPHAVIRGWAASQYPRLPGRGFTTRIVELLDDPERPVCLAAIRAIGAAGLASAGARLLALAQRHDDAQARVVAVEALGELAHAPAVPWLRAQVRTAHDDLGLAAIISLGDIADPSAYAELLPLLGDADQTVALKAHWALSQLPLTQEEASEVESVWQRHGVAPRP